MLTKIISNHNISFRSMQHQAARTTKPQVLTLSTKVARHSRQQGRTLCCKHHPICVSCRTHCAAQAGTAREERSLSPNSTTCCSIQVQQQQLSMGYPLRQAKLGGHPESWAQKPNNVTTRVGRQTQMGQRIAPPHKHRRPHSVTATPPEGRCTGSYSRE